MWAHKKVLLWQTRWLSSKDTMDKPENPPQKPHWKEITDSVKMSSDLHMDTR